MKVFHVVAFLRKQDLNVGFSCKHVLHRFKQLIVGNSMQENVFAVISNGLILVKTRVFPRNFYAHG